MKAVTQTAALAAGNGRLKNKRIKKTKMPVENKRAEPVKDVNSKQKQQNFNLWAIMQQETELPHGIKGQWGVQARGI